METLEEKLVRWFCVLAVVSVVVFIIGMGVSLARYDATPERRIQFEAWCRFNHREDVAFEDWRTLLDANLLPGQVKDDGGADTTLGVAVGIGVGSAMAPKR